MPCGNAQNGIGPHQDTATAVERCCGWTKSVSHHLSNVVQDFVHPQYYTGLHQTKQSQLICLTAACSDARGCQGNAFLEFCRNKWLANDPDIAWVQAHLVWPHSLCRRLDDQTKNLLREARDYLNNSGFYDIKRTYVSA